MTKALYLGVINRGRGGRSSEHQPGAYASRFNVVELFPKHPRTFFGVVDFAGRLAYRFLKALVSRRLAKPT